MKLKRHKLTYKKYCYKDGDSSLDGSMIFFLINYLYEIPQDSLPPIYKMFHSYYV